MLYLAEALDVTREEARNTIPFGSKVSNQELNNILCLC